MKMCNLKMWLPGMILGLSLLAAVPVSADITNSGSTPPLIEFSKVSNTNDVAAEAGSQKSSDSGKVYDFKDSKTSGVVTVTKSWDDNMSNNERSIPDVTISTEPYHRNPLGYTISYHGNGLTFADGSTENEILVNASGKIISGQFKTIPGQVKWYSDTKYTREIVLDSNGLPSEKITGDLDLYAHKMTYVLKTGSNFNRLIPSSTTSIIFTDEEKPASADLIDVDADGDNGVVAWMDGTAMKVSSQIYGQKIFASVSSNNMFYNQSNLKSIDLSNLDTHNVTNMVSMFESCSGLTSLDLTSLNTSSVTNMSWMFLSCHNLVELNLSSFNTENVTGMNSMFCDCVSLTSIDLSNINTSNVTNMDGMFSYCDNLTKLNLYDFDTNNVISMKRMFKGSQKLVNISLGDRFVFVGSNYNLPSGTWYSSNGTAYTSDGTTCTIPSSKADTYTRR